VRVQAVSTFVGGSQKSGFTLSGIYPDPRVFNVVALDAAGNTIVARGARRFPSLRRTLRFQSRADRASVEHLFGYAVGTQDATASLTVRASFADATTCKQSDAACSAKVASTSILCGGRLDNFRPRLPANGRADQETGLPSQPYLDSSKGGR